MLEILLTALLTIGLAYALMLATNPPGAWKCPISCFIDRFFKGRTLRPRGQG